MGNNYKYLVCTHCYTYNHAPYIVDAMNGFCLQETQFPFVCTIVDDASNDGEQEVIKNYLNEHFDLEDKKVAQHEETDDYVLTFARHKTNMNCYFAVLYLKYNHYKKKPKAPYLARWRENAKYIAFCEGDDYWIDSLKLQKQVEFMESHPKHSLCFCSRKALLPNGKLSTFLRYDKDVEECPINDIIMAGGGFAATNSMLYRNSMHISYSTWVDNAVVGDLPITLTLAVKGKVGYLVNTMCVYRCNANGSWSERMKSSFLFRLKNFKGIRHIWKKFDAWTQYRYHTIVRKKMNKDLKNFFETELRYMKYSISKFLKMGQNVKDEKSCKKLI